MRIFSHVHTFGRNEKQGADKMMRSLLEYLASRCEVIVGIDDCPVPYVLNGVSVISNRYMIAEHYEVADAIIANIEMNHPSLTIAKRFNKPVFQIAHNNENKTYQPYIIYNSVHLRDEMNLPYDNIVVNPPTYLNDDGINHFEQPYITLVNCCPNKGAEMLASLATWMPERKFLGIYGGYGHQMSKPIVNLTYRPFQNPLSYADTRLLIVPSKKESWSLCASEAMATGIPVICADLPGLVENCGDAANYCSSLRDYMDAILFLDNPFTYNIFVERGRKRIAERNHAEQLDNLYNFIADKVMPKNKITIREEGNRPIDTSWREYPPITDEQAAEFEREKVEIKPVNEKREIKKPGKKKIVRR